MIPITSLLVPILLGAVLVFVASAIIHMLLPYHRNDLEKLSDEDGVMSALRSFDIAPGDYVMPFAGGPEAMKSEAFRAKVDQGPVAVMTVMDKKAMLSMGPQLAQWFVYCVLVGIFSAYVAGRTLGAGVEYLSVFRLTGTVAFACYSMGLMQRSIWFSQKWSTTLKSMVDGFVYALLTAGAFGWLWPA